MNRLTWNDLLLFLLKQKENDAFRSDDYVMVYNAETGDEHYCDVWNTTTDSSRQERLVIGYNFDSD
jgi:hypothetical protein